MDSDQQSDSSQGFGKRSASSDDHQDNKRLKPDEVDSDTESLDDLLTDDDDKEDDDDFDVELTGLSSDIALSTSSSTAYQSKSSSDSTYDILSPQELAVQMNQRIENVKHNLNMR